MIDWKHKLLAFLHDPPSKVLDIPNHQEMAKTLLRQAGFSDDEAEQFSRPADWAASAADRLPFPNSMASNLRCQFDGVRNCFHHPLGSGSDQPLRFPFEGEFITADAAHETDQTVQPVLTDYGGIPDDAADPAGQRWRARFFAHWRLWPKHAVERDCRFGFLPADTRIPDHTIWTHMQVVSALAGCASETEPGAAPKPAFLKVQIGPVQDFIAAARSIRDLWSGSYLLSWLMAAGLKALSAEAGPMRLCSPICEDSHSSTSTGATTCGRRSGLGTKRCGNPWAGNPPTSSRRTCPTFSLPSFRQPGLPSWAGRSRTRSRVNGKRSPRTSGKPAERRA
jgi:CRISPR-associated protein Cmr2